MTCPECQTSWCYFCGVKESLCDKSEQTNSTDESATPLYLHNIEWSTNCKRLV
jgi:hypothetical protein